MSGYRMWRLAILIPLILLKYAFYSSHDSDYDYTPPAFNYTPPSFDYTPPALPLGSDTDDDNKPAHVADPLHEADGDAPDIATAKGDLEPVIATPGAFGASGNPLPHVMLGDNAAIGLTLGDPGSVVGATWLTSWKLSPGQALAFAVANLRQDHIAFVQVEPGLWSTPDSDDMGAARILLVDDIKKLHLAGGPVAMIPNRGRLLLAGASDAKGLAAMATRAGELATGSHVIHTIPLCLTGSAWKECLPKPSADVAQQLGDLAANGRVAVYDEVSDTYQKELGDDIFVAHVKVISADDKPSFTIVNWLKGYPSMLPKAEYVAFVLADDPDKPTVLGLAPWDRVMKVCGAHMKANGRLPTYWANDGWWPSAAEMKQIALKPLP